jgi:hypothetical protein
MPIGFTHMVYKWYRDIAVFSLSFLLCKSWTSLGLPCIGSLSPMPKLSTLALIFPICAYRQSFLIRCFDRRSASSADNRIPETHLFVLNWRLNEDLRHDSPPPHTMGIGQTLVASVSLFWLPQQCGLRQVFIMSWTTRLCSIYSLASSYCWVRACDRSSCSLVIYLI